LVSRPAPGGEGVHEAGAEVAFVGRNSGEQVVENVLEALGGLHDPPRRLDARPLVVAGAEKLREADDDCQGRLELVCEGGELRVALVVAHSRPRL
jgi:hypothetical protein